MDFPCETIVFSVKKAAEPNIFKTGQSVLPKAVTEQNAAGPFGIPFHQCGKFLLVDPFKIFVAVKDENPVIGSLSNSIVFGGAKIVYPVKMTNLIGIAGGNFPGPVGGACVG